MKTLLAILVLAVPVYAGGKFTVTRGFTVTPGIEVSIPAPEPSPALSANIFADYPAAKLLAALQPQPQPVARAVRPNVGNCQCGQGRCICQPARICKNCCPAVVNLRKDEVKYFFPAFDPNCPTGR